MVYNFQQLSTKILETLELLVSFRDGTSTGEGMEKDGKPRRAWEECSSGCLNTKNTRWGEMRAVRVPSGAMAKLEARALTYRQSDC